MALPSQWMWVWANSRRGWQTGKPEVLQLMKSQELDMTEWLNNNKIYRCESWTIKKAEDQRINAFNLWCWRRLSRALWTSRRSNQSILNEINPEYWLEWMILKLKLQYFSHLIQKANFFGRDSNDGKEWRQNEKRVAEDEVVRHTWIHMNLSKLWETVKDRGAWHAAVHEVTQSWTQLRNWTTTCCTPLWTDDFSQWHSLIPFSLSSVCLSFALGFLCVEGDHWEDDDSWLTHELDPGNQRIFTLPCPWNV